MACGSAGGMPSSIAAPPSWHRERFAAKLPRLLARARIKEAVRRFFLDRGYVEVETPVLQVSPGNETHVSAFATAMVGDDGRSSPLGLHTSPEFACKKLLAAGLERLFTLGPVFRNRERGRLHHPEFTMLEWYRAGATLDEVGAEAVALLRVAAEAAGATELRHRDSTADPFAEPEVLTVAQAFRRYGGVDLDVLSPHLPGRREKFARILQTYDPRISDDESWSDLFSRLVTKTEQHFGIGRPTLLQRYPVSEAALATVCRDDPRYAERFELYCCGVELANAFHELADPVEQRRRFEAAEAERLRIYGERHPIDEDFLACLPHMPDCCGIALGFDRLVMLATAAERIDDVLWLPVAEPPPGSAHGTAQGPV